jgi:hypothetical protein
VLFVNNAGYISEIIEEKTGSSYCIFKLGKSPVQPSWAGSSYYIFEIIEEKAGPSYHIFTLEKKSRKRDQAIVFLK